MTPIATLDIRRQSMILTPEGLNSPTGIHAGQFYGDHDLTCYDPGAGSVVVLRQVLVPPGFRPMDATDTHVWGVRRGEFGVEFVVGRRLVPPDGADSRG